MNRVDDVPQVFKDWLQDNAERSERTYSKPYFITDNEKYIPKACDLGYHHNCQTCTLAYELRRRGFAIEAMANLLSGSVNGIAYREFDLFCAGRKTDWTQRFLAADGTELKPMKAVGLADTNEAKRLFIEGHTATQGRYEVYCQWKKDGAHVFIAERQKNGNLLWYDPQTGQKAEEFAERYLSNMKPSEIWVTRIDDAIINPVFAKRLIKSGT